MRAFQRADLGSFYDTVRRHEIPLFVLTDAALTDTEGTQVEPHEMRGATLVLDREQALRDVEGLTVAIMEYLAMRRPFRSMESGTT